MIFGWAAARSSATIARTPPDWPSSSLRIHSASTSRSRAAPAARRIFLSRRESQRAPSARQPIAVQLQRRDRPPRRHAQLMDLLDVVVDLPGRQRQPIGHRRQPRFERDAGRIADAAARGNRINPFAEPSHAESLMNYTTIGWSTLRLIRSDRSRPSRVSVKASSSTSTHTAPL